MTAISGLTGNRGHCAVFAVAESICPNAQLDAILRWIAAKPAINSCMILGKLGESATVVFTCGQKIARLGTTKKRIGDSAYEGCLSDKQPPYGDKPQEGG